MKVLALCLLLTACGCATVQPPLRMRGSEMWAFMIWDCRDPAPTIFFRRDVVFSRDSLLLEADEHELKHDFDAKRIGCVEWNRRRAASQAFRDTVEARAACAQWEVAKHRRKPGAFAYVAKYNPQIQALVLECIRE